jgi:multidrug efflux system membrane fusion protein
MRVRLVAVIVLVLLALGGLYLFQQRREQAVKAALASQARPPIPVEAIAAEKTDVPRRLEGIGSLYAIDQVTIAPQVPGQVSQIYFESGDTVEKGARLVQLNDAIERADLASFNAQAKLAASTLSRTASLAARDFAAQQTVDQNQSALDQANAGIARAQAVIDQKIITAPFGGVLGIRQIDPGQYVSAGATIVSLTDLDRLQVDFTLPEQQRWQILVGQDLEIRTDAYPDRVFKATLNAIEPQINQDTRTVDVQGRLDNKDRQLTPGMFVRVSVILPPVKDAIVVPQTAIDASLYGDSVYRLKPGNEGRYTVEQAAVTTGVRFGDKVEVRTGLKEGDMVVTSGQVRIDPGAEVTIAKGSLLKTPATPPLN